MGRGRDVPHRQSEPSWEAAALLDQDTPNIDDDKNHQYQEDDSDHLSPDQTRHDDDQVHTDRHSSPLRCRICQCVHGQKGALVKEPLVRICKCKHLNPVHASCWRDWKARRVQDTLGNCSECGQSLWPTKLGLRRIQQYQRILYTDLVLWCGITMLLLGTIAYFGLLVPCAVDGIAKEAHAQAQQPKQEESTSATTVSLIWGSWNQECVTGKCVYVALVLGVLGIGLGGALALYYACRMHCCRHQDRHFCYGCNRPRRYCNCLLESLLWYHVWDSEPVAVSSRSSHGRAASVPLPVDDDEKDGKTSLCMMILIGIGILVACAAIGALFYVLILWRIYTVRKQFYLEHVRSSSV